MDQPMMTGHRDPHRGTRARGPRNDLLRRRAGRSHVQAIPELLARSPLPALVLRGSQVVEGNAAAGQALGRAPETLLGLPLAALSPRQQADGRVSEHVASTLLQAAREGRPQSGAWRFSRPDGSTLEAEVSLSAWGELALALFRPARSPARADMGGAIAHDLANLLSAIRGSVDLAERRPDSPQRLQERLRTIRRCTEHARALLMRAIPSRVQGSTMRRSLDLSALVRETMLLLESVLPSTIRVDLRFDPALWSVRGDPQLLEQLLMNLVLNARDAMSGGGTLSIVARNEQIGSGAAAADAAQPERYVCIEVRDTGVGIAPELQGRIFEPFFTTKAPHEGTGLGLAIVRDAVEAHGGFVDYESTLGEGTCFWVYVPASGEPVSSGRDECCPPGGAVVPSRGRADA